MKRRRMLNLMGTAGALTATAAVSSSSAEETVSGLFIEGYSGRVSYAPGETAAFHVSTSAPKYDLRIERVGQDRTLVWEKKGLPGQFQPVPVDASSQSCRWMESVSVPLATEWKSGYYEVTLTVTDKGGDFIQRNKRSAESTFFFVLRAVEPGKKSKVLLQLATNTYNAYNNWGGTSLYAYNGRGKIQGHEVSFLRPPSSQFNRWELPFVTWAEKEGIALDYAANMDLELRPELLSHYRLVLSVGHDEYWSSGMRDHLEAFIAKGGNAAFFSGNTCCWQVRWNEATQSLLSWKQWYNQDPLYKSPDERLLSSLWSHHLVKRPENQLTGVGFIHGGYHLSHGQFMDGNGAFKVHRPDHWIWEGAGVKQGDEFGGADTIVGYECDGCELEWKDGLPHPTYRDGTPETFQILATCPARWAPGDCYWYDRWPGPDHAGNAVLGSYTVPQGGTVFTTGTTDWSHGLARDAVVRAVTKNVLHKLSA